MRAALLGLLLGSAGLSGSAYAQELFPLQAVPPIGSACTITPTQYNTGAPSPTPCPVGVTPPAGQHFDLTFYDDFTRDTSVDGNKFIIEGYCNQNGGFLSFDSNNGIGIQAPVTNTVQNRCDITTGGVFHQLYGYWEWSMKEPTDVSGEGDGLHTDIWFRGTSTGEGENDNAEKVLGTGNRTYTWHQIHEWITGDGAAESGQYAYPQTVNIDEDFHIYGDEWLPDGNNGTMQNFWDGSAFDPPYALQLPEWGSGVNTIMSMDTDTNCYGGGSWTPWGGGNYCGPQTSFNNPFYIRYMAVWQLVPN